MHSQDPGAASDESRRSPRRRRVSRRVFIEGAVCVAGAGALASALPALSRGATAEAAAPAQSPAQAARGAVAAQPRGPVVGFHMDQPYWDPTGTAEPYLPPAGVRSGDALAELAEDRLIGQFGYW